MGTVSSSAEAAAAAARRRKNFSISVVHNTAEANTMQITHCQTVKLVVAKRRFAKSSHVSANTSSTDHALILINRSLSSVSLLNTERSSSLLSNA